MVHTTAITAAAAALLVALPINAGLYSKSSPVIQVDGKNYDRLIAQSNYTSIVEFYAPWCGHCKNLQPAYEKAAKSLAGLGKVAAMDCDADENKAFCGQFSVQGFPTLKIVKPGKKPGKPFVEDYQGGRSAKDIVEAVIDKIPNHVKRIADKDLEGFLAEANDTAKALLFTNKGKTTALLKSIAIEFKGSLKVAQIRDTDKASVELFGITKFPTLILLPGGMDTESKVYDGEMKKEPMVQFLSQAATPNPDPAPAKVKLPKFSTAKDKKASSKSKEAFESASASHAKSERPITATDETLQEPTESPSPEFDSQKPVVLPDPAPPIPILSETSELLKACLGPKTGTCILALLPKTPDEHSGAVVSALSEIAQKYKTHNRPIFPFYVLPEKNSGFAELTKKLGLTGKTELIALNGRGWWRRIEKEEFYVQGNEETTQEKIEAWVDIIRLGDGVKHDLPGGLVVEPESSVEDGEKPPADGVKEEEPPEPVVPEEPSADNTKAQKTEDAKEPEPVKHGEL